MNSQPHSGVCVCVCVHAGLDYDTIREQNPVESFTKVYTFNSSRKSMSTVLPLEEGGYRVHTKGASEIVLKKCSSIMKENGQVVPLTKSDQLEIIKTVVKPMAEGALRTIALAYRYMNTKWVELQVTNSGWSYKCEIVGEVTSVK